MGEMARATVLERGGVPLGFNSAQHFQQFGRTARAELAAAGHADAEPFIRGSAVTGYSYTTGEAFDVGRRSDYDVVLVSPTLMRRAEDLGIPLRGQGSRTWALRNRELEKLGLSDLRRAVESQAGREVTFMIYRSREAVERRGPYLLVP
jgi:filamentous hemagglutinin